jgi:predicted membrane protein
MKNNSESQISTQIILGIIVTAFGLAFLFDNFGWIDAYRVLRLWPILIIIAGVLKIMQTQTNSGYVTGGGLILLGAAMTLHRLGIVDFSWHKWWPALLIVVGVSVVIKAMDRHQTPQSAMPAEPMQKAPMAVSADDTVDATAILGAYRRSLRSQNFRGGEITAVLGGVEIDLRQASINGEAVLRVFAIWGGIDIKVPPDWTVVLQGTPILGGFDEKTSVPPNSAKRLVIQGYVIMGGLEVKN